MEGDKIKNFLFGWNNTFPFDRFYREKYKIPFNSKKHQKVCQIDVLFDILEDSIFKEYVQKEIELQQKYKQYQESGKIFIVSDKDEEDRFNKFIPLRPEAFRNLKNNQNG